MFVVTFFLVQFMATKALTFKKLIFLGREEGISKRLTHWNM